MVSPIEQQNVNLLARARAQVGKVRKQMVSMRRKGQLRARYRAQIVRLRGKLAKLKREQVKIVRPGLDSLMAIAFTMALFKDLFDFAVGGAIDKANTVLWFFAWAGKAVSVVLTIAGFISGFIIGLVAFVIIGFCLVTVILMDPAMKGFSKLSITFIFAGGVFTELIGFGFNLLPFLTAMVLVLYWRIIVIRRKKRKKQQKKIESVKKRIKQLQSKLRRFSLSSALRRG